jgi:hypothetical protein
MPGTEYNKELCEERHEKLDRENTLLFKKSDEVVDCVSKKFNQVLFWIILTLLSVIGSLAIIIITRSVK